MIRALTEADAEAIAQLHQQSFPFGWTTADVHTMLATPGTYGWGMGHSALDAMMIVRIGDDTADILTLAVSAAFRRQGLAQQLMAHVRVQLKPMSVARLMLEVAVINSAAIALYQQTGFQEIARRSAYYRQPDGSRADAIVMEKRL